MRKRKFDRPTLIVYGIIILVLSILLINDYNKAQHLENHDETYAFDIHAVDIGQRCYVEYKYLVNGIVYNGADALIEERDRPGLSNSEIERLTDLKIWYSVDDPSISKINDKRLETLM